MRPVPHPRHVFALIIFAAVATAAGTLAALDENLSDAQVGIATAAVKEHDPELYAHDPIYGPSGMWRFGTPVFQGALKFLLVPTAYGDLLLPFRVMTPIMVFVYLCGMYALVYHQCRSWSISAFTAVLSSTIIYCLGDSHWGTGSLGSMTPGSACLAVTPLIVLALLRYVRQWRVLLVFLFVGLMGNVHLPTALNLTLVLLIVYLGRRGFRPAAWPMTAACAMVAVVGALPYTWYYFKLRSDMMPAGVQTTAAGAQRAFSVGGLSVLYPDTLPALLNWVLFAIILAIPAVAVLSRVERFRTRNLWLWVWFVAGALFVALGLSALSQLISHLTGKAPEVIDFVRASGLVMLPLYVLFAQALTNLFRLIRTHRVWVRWVCVALLAGWMLPSDNLRVLRYAALDTATMFMEEADKPRRVQKHHRRHNERVELAAIGRWARENTRRDAVFVTGKDEFRLLGRRSIVASPDDVEHIYYCTPWELGEWADLVTRQRKVLHPPTGTVIPEALATFVAQLEQRPGLGGVKEWYTILSVSVAPEKNETLERVSGDWGKHYRLYRLH